jgi:hypothetical protein
MTANHHPFTRSSLSWILGGGLIGLLLSPTLKACAISLINVPAPLGYLGFLAACVDTLLELPFGVIGSNPVGYALVMLFWGIVGSLVGYVIDTVIDRMMSNR